MHQALSDRMVAGVGSWARRASVSLWVNGQNGAAATYCSGSAHIGGVRRMDSSLVFPNVSRKAISAIPAIPMCCIGEHARVMRKPTPLKYGKGAFRARCNDIGAESITRFYQYPALRPSGSNA